MQNLNVVLDVSSVIWDEADYNTNTHEYIELVDGITAFFEKLENEKPRVLLSGNLRDELMSNFPYGKPPHYGGDFEGQTLRFLSKVETCEYPSVPIQDITSIPNLIKGYFKDEVKHEIGLLISRIHADNTEYENVYFTFDYLWENEKLKTRVNTEIKDYQTIVADRGTELDDFFASLKPVFEHNPKHTKASHRNKQAWEDSDNKLGFESQLSCYNGVDNKIPQEILDKCYPEKIDSRYIGYDEENSVFVVFRCHIDNKYHGYDEYNENNLERIPLRVRKFLNK